MGTKKSNYILTGTFFKANLIDPMLLKSGKITQNPNWSKMTAPSEKSRVNHREENWRKEIEFEKMRDKAVFKDMEIPDRTYERDCGPTSRLREGEKEWREKERGKRLRQLSNLENEADQAILEGKSKGGTFPRIRKDKPDSYDEGMTTGRERRQRDCPRGEDKDAWERDKQRRRESEDVQVWNRGKEHKERYADAERSRQRDRYKVSGVDFQDETRGMMEFRDMREGNRTRKLDIPRSEMDGGMARTYSPHRTAESESYAKSRDKRSRGRRVVRSEEDSDERWQKREKKRDKEREELTHQLSRSVEENQGETDWGRDRERQRYRERDSRSVEDSRSRAKRDKERDRQRHIERETERSKRRERENSREKYRGDERRAANKTEGDKWRERRREEDDNYRKDRPDRERKERQEDKAGRSSRSQSDSVQGAPPQFQSSEERSYDVEREATYRRGSYDDRDKMREGTYEPRRGKERQEDPGRREKHHKHLEKNREETTGYQKWLDPQRGNNNKDYYYDRERRARQNEWRSDEERNTDSQAEWGRNGRRVEEQPDERYSDKSKSKGNRGERTEYRIDPEGVSVDADPEDEMCREAYNKEKEHLSDSDVGKEAGGDNTGCYEKEEEGGSDNCAHSGGDEGSEVEWMQHKERMPTGEENYATPSSGEDEEDEQHSHGETFKDSHELTEVLYQDTSAGFKGCEEENDKQRVMRKENCFDEEKQEKRKEPKFVFCVIGQTLFHSETSVDSPSRDDQRSGVEKGNHDECVFDMTENSQDAICFSEDTEDDPTANHQDTREDCEPPSGDPRCSRPSELQSTELVDGTLKQGFRKIKRDSQTEKLLRKWRDQKKEEEHNSDTKNLNQTHPLPEHINTETKCAKEQEATKKTGTWSSTEETKRRSQAPHLKWAKDVVRQFLGHSEEHVDDEPNGETTQSESNKMTEVASERTLDLPVVTLTRDKSDINDEDYLTKFGGMGQSQVNMHTDRVKAMHVTTHTHAHADIQINTGGEEKNTMGLNTEPFDQSRLEKSDPQIDTDTENEAFLNPNNTLYKPNSCPTLNHHSKSELLSSFREIKSRKVKAEMCQSEDEVQGEESDDRDSSVEIGKVGVGVNVNINEGKVGPEEKKVNEHSSSSFLNWGSQAPFRRKGIRKPTERRNGERVEMKEEGGGGRDRRPLIYSSTDDEELPSRSWEDGMLRSSFSTGDWKRKSRLLINPQLYQQYNEAAQDKEIRRQARSGPIAVDEDGAYSPLPSPPAARRPLPPLPGAPHPHSLFSTGSVTSVKSLTLPETPRNGGRPSSPRLSVSLSQSPSLWRELPGVKNSEELAKFGEAERRLQEVRFEVLTSEASYCKSLDIAVDHFVKSKQLGAVLTSQDKNWLFSRLLDVRATSHRFLSKLEERVESNVMHFTVCDLIAEHCSLFRGVYVPYLANQSYQDNTYQRLMNENPSFKQIVENLERSPVCQRLPFRSFLVLPFQRITRMKLLVQNIVKRTTPNTPEWMQAGKALKLLSNLIQESDDSISQMKSIESLVTLSAKVEFECKTLPLISQFRRLVREGLVTEFMHFNQKESERKIYLHVFNDCLLVSLPKEGGRFTVIDHCTASERRAENCSAKLFSLKKNVFQLYIREQRFLLGAETESDKLRWISAISKPKPATIFPDGKEWEQMQCIRTFVGQQPDEMSLEKADIILVDPEQLKCDDWVNGTKLSDRLCGWVPRSHLEIITNDEVKKSNLSDAVILTTATDAV